MTKRRFNLYIIFFIALLAFFSIRNLEIGVWIHLYNRLFGFKNSKKLFHMNNQKLLSSVCATQKLVLYGIFSVASEFEKRKIVRSKKSCHMNNEFHSTVFVIGAPDNVQDHKHLISESLIYNDIFVLNCKENMNDGKSFQYFRQAVSEMPCFRFYAKIDDDTAFRAAEISALLSNISTRNVYLGKKILNEDGYGILNMRKSIYFNRNMDWLKTFKYYHAGLLYILDKDIIKKWVELKPKLFADEDMRTAYYMNVLNATIIDFSDSFHAVILKTWWGTWERIAFVIKYNFYKFFKLMTEGESIIWQQPISKTSLAVHLCKDPQILSDVFDELCQ